MTTAHSYSVPFADSFAQLENRIGAVEKRIYWMWGALTALATPVAIVVGRLVYDWISDL